MHAGRKAGNSMINNSIDRALDRRILEVGLNLSLWRHRWCTLQPVCKEEFSVVLADS